MQEESDYLSQVEEYVWKDNKIVTCKWLSKQLNIHINVAKRLLSTFIDKSNQDFSVCYVIGGVKANGSQQILVTRKENLANVKALFTNVTSEHVYSVQKTTKNEDIKLSHIGVDNSYKPTDGPKSGLSAIKCEDSIKRSLTDLERIAPVIMQNKPTETNAKETNLDAKKLTNGSVFENKQNSNSANNCAPANDVKNSESNCKKKTGIATMFATQKNGKTNENKVPSQVQKQSPKNKPKGMAAFLAQTSENKKAQPLSKTEEVGKNDLRNIEDKTTLTNVNKENSKEPEESIQSPETVKKLKGSTSSDGCSNSKTISTKKSNKSKEAAKKRKKHKGSDVQAKKRKRIVTLSDSDSSDEDHRERTPSPLPREPTPPPPVSDDEDPTPTSSQTGKKAKKKKLVEKTFLDDDGFLVTDKEYVFATSSEDEETDLSVKKSVENGTSDRSSCVASKDEEKESNSKLPKNKIKDPPKKTSPQKVKQASIMNFFGKKS